MAHDVFISYSSKDKPIADAVCANIEAAGIRCWIAPRDIAPGEDWPTAITTAISKSRVMVLIFSSNSNSSEDVGRELMLAANSKVIIIPFKIENIDPEPGKQYYLARTHWLDAVNPPTQEQIGILVQRVKTILSDAAPAATTQAEPTWVKPPIPEPRPAPKKKKTSLLPLWIAAGLVVLAGIVAVIWIASSAIISRLTAAPVPTPTSTLTISSPTILPTGTASLTDFSGYVGTWSGITVNGDFQMQITITFSPGCAVNQECAHYEIPSLPCSGDFVFIKVTDGMYEFHAVNKQGTCGAAQDFLQLQQDGTLLYDSKGDFGENRGFLQKTAQVLFSTGFDNPSYEGSIDPDFWSAPTSDFYFSVQQKNGAMTFSTQNLQGDQNGKITSRMHWFLNDISYAEAKLKLDQPVYGGNANNAVTLADAGGLWAGCGIQAGEPNPFIWCGQGGEYPESYMSESYPAEYGKWYTIRIVFIHQTDVFEGYIDGSLFYSWQPTSIEQMLKQDMTVSIGLWTDSATSITGYADDVLVVK